MSKDNKELTVEEKKQELKRLEETEGLIIRTSPFYSLDEMPPDGIHQLYIIIQEYLKIPKSVN